MLRGCLKEQVEEREAVLPWQVHRIPTGARCGTLSLAAVRGATLFGQGLLQNAYINVQSANQRSGFPVGGGQGRGGRACAWPDGWGAGWRSTFRSDVFASPWGLLKDMPSSSGPANPSTLPCIDNLVRAFWCRAGWTICRPSPASR